MTRKRRPSLKDYLKTGEVHLEPETLSFPTEGTPAEQAPEQTSTERTATEQAPTERTSVEKTDAEWMTPPAAIALSKLLSATDRRIWEPILDAGTKITVLPLNLVALREEFRTMDRDRFTFFILEREGANLRPVRTSVQIRDPLTLLLRWDESGELTLFAADPSILNPA